MKRTFALAMALALASFGVSAYAQTAPADQGSTHKESSKKKKQTKKKKDTKDAQPATQK